MTTYYSLTSVQALANLRVDLNDTNSGAYRWTDATLNRCIDRALERYSWVYPFFQSIQIPTITSCNIYALPAGAWYVDRVEYPVGRYPKNFPPFFERKSPALITPLVAPTASDGGPGDNLSAGAYQWAFTCVGPDGGETLPSPIASLTLAAAHKATLTVPKGQYGCQTRNIYRTVAGGAQLKLAGSLADNVSGSFVDNTADGSLGANAPVSNTTAGIDMVELQIPPELYPSDTTTYIIEIAYASKHILDSSLGTTVPERHWDALYYGAVAFAMEEYLPSVNDNFEYQDGHLRDRVDDSKVPIAWQTQCQMAKRDFESRLRLIKEESNTGVSLSTHWGDVPLRYDRL